MTGSTVCAMRRGIIAAATLAALFTPAAADARPHHHDHRPCVAARELSKIRIGWTRDRIERFTETAGLGLRTSTGTPTIYGYSYPACRPGFRVLVDYTAADNRSYAVKLTRGGYASYPPGT